MSSPVLVKPFPVEEEYKKPNGITPQDISKLRQWLDTQPHLPGQLISDLDLILTFHCCDRSTEVTKQVLDLHFTLRTLFAIFKNRIVNDDLIRTMHIYLALPLEVRTPAGSAVMYTRLIDYDVKNFHFQEGVRLVLMSMDLWQQEEGTWPGFEIIIDLEGVTLSHIARLDLQTVQQFLYYLQIIIDLENDVTLSHNTRLALQTVQQFLYYLQEAMLVKLKALHFLNAPSFMDKIMMIIKPFMKKSLLDTLAIHQIGSRTLEKYMSMDGLPKECGGKYKSLEQARDDTIVRFKLNAKYFSEENKRRVVEARRPGKPKTISDIFGSVEGSFKKLDID